ncbi:uncharacterized protein LOC135948141 isoform X2 [Cloeon dipterum]|uniref:uncharacterized protein LOC135948141 isoform X2 n=1 Tax=Cloeon dipterum TaxID=197152 RepID=UPI0032202C18
MPLSLQANLAQQARASRNLPSLRHFVLFSTFFRKFRNHSSMAVPLNLPTFHDPRARLNARLSRQLAKLLDTLHQLEQLDHQSSTLDQQQWLEPELGDWLILDEAAEGQQPTLIPISPMLVVDALRAVQQEEYFDQVAGDFYHAPVALASRVSCHADSPHAPHAAASPPNAEPFAATAASTRPSQSPTWRQVGSKLRRLANDQKTSDSAPSIVNGRNVVKTLFSSVLPKKLGYTAATIYMGMRLLLRLNLRDF